METMNSNNTSNGKIIDRRIILSTLWIFAVLNYLYCDIVSFMDSNILKLYLAGKVGDMQISQGFLLAGSILMEISISMVLLSRILKHKANRLINIIAGIITTLAQISSLLMGKPTMYYIFFSAIEISTTVFIVWYAWKWKLNEQVDK